MSEDGKGLGLVASRKLNSKETCERPTLLEVPGDLVLSAEGLEEWKKVDWRLKEILEKVGGKVCFWFSFSALGGVILKARAVMGRVCVGLRCAILFNSLGNRFSLHVGDED